MKPLKLLAGILLGAVALGFIVSIPFYAHEMAQIRKSLRANSKTMESPYGTIEYVDIGSGTPVLVSHGTMGGYDLGLLQAQGFTGEGHRFIIPSRFGYLRSSLPADPSFELQADCYAYLLEQLNIDRAIVQGMSAGGVPALQFAIRHPDKCEGLILMSSIAYAPPADFQKQELPLPDSVYRALLKSDYLFWMLLKLAPKSLQSIYGVSEELVASSDEREVELLEKMSHVFLPVSERYAGWEADGEDIDSLKELPLENITAPTLIISAKDDTIAPYVLSTYTAERIRNAQLVTLETGGHVLLGHMQEVTDINNAFIEGCAAKK